MSSPYTVPDKRIRDSPEESRDTMNFDPRTKAREEEEDNEENLKLFAIICASLDTHPEKTDLVISMAFQRVWNDAMKLESAVKFYRRIDKAKEILGF